MQRMRQQRSNLWESSSVADRVEQFVPDPEFGRCCLRVAGEEFQRTGSETHAAQVLLEPEVIEGRLALAAERSAFVESAAHRIEESEALEDASLHARAELHLVTDLL